MKLLGAVAAVMAALVMAGAVSAADEVNLLENYAALEWQGDSLVYDSRSGAVYFENTKNAANVNYYASYDIEVTGEDNGFYFFIDGGNGANTSDYGSCYLYFYGEDGEELFAVCTIGVNGLESYSRFYKGSEDTYFPLPEGTRKITIVLQATPYSEKGRINVYFRNPALYLSNEKPLEGNKDDYIMKSISGLSKVEVGVNSAVRWIWIGIVFAVSMVFYFVRMRREKYRTAEVMKAGERKR